MKPTAFPLFWPPDQARTRKPRRAKFQVTTDVARRDMVLELQRLGAMNVTVSTNIPLRRDGQPYADGDPDDAGVAIYFLLDHGQGQVEHVIACDAWDLVKDNYRAIAKTVEAVRGIERWGATELMKRMFSSFRMLRAAGPAPRAWHVVLEVPAGARAAEIREAYLRLAKQHHPDKALNLHQQKVWTDCKQVIDGPEAVIQTNTHLTCKQCSSEWRENRMPS